MNSLHALKARCLHRTNAAAQALQCLHQRFKADRLAMVAGSLTFTTTMSLVPLVSVGLAIFSAFPVFGRVQAQLQQWFMQSLIPETIARQVTNYLLQFSDKASKVGWMGAVFLLVTALSLVLTMDRALNDIWRVRRPRPLGQRVLVYWAALTLGPLLLGGSLSLSSYALSVSRGWVQAVSGDARWWLNSVDFLLGWGGLMVLYRWVPHAQVRWRHALLGAGVAATGLEGAKHLLAWYWAQVPTYSLVYGAFATLPILWVWLYIAWVIVLVGALLTASLPLWTHSQWRRDGGLAWDLELALRLLACLRDQRDAGRGGAGLMALSEALSVDPLALEAPLEVLEALDWVACLDQADARYVLLVHEAQVPVMPLLERLCLPVSAATLALRQATAWDHLVLAQVLPAPGAGPVQPEIARFPGANLGQNPVCGL